MKMQTSGAAILVATVLAAVVLAPAGASAELAAGHPEAYTNGIRVGDGSAAAIAGFGYGDILLKSEELENSQHTGGYLECTSFGVGSVYNAGSPSRAAGQVLGWAAQGHAPQTVAGVEHTELSSECRGLNSISNNITETAFLTDETSINFKAGEESRGHITTPWNVETECGTREKVKVTIVKIGVPTERTPAELAAAEARGCLTEAKEAEETKKEKEKEEGCYNGTGKGKVAPPGCIQLIIFAPIIGLEWGYGGTQRVKMTDGTGNGLDQSVWELEKKENTGTLVCTHPTACTAPFEAFGLLKVQGYEAVSLITAK